VLVSVFHEYIHIDIVHFIMGDVLGIADSDLWVAAIVASIVLTLIILFFRYFQITAFDPIMAASIGIPVVLIDYLLTTSVSLVVVSAVSMVGVILVVGLLITPAATAYLLSDRLDRMMILAAIFGTTSVIGGLYISIWLDSSGGGAIMLFCTFQFLVVLAVAPRYGMIAKKLRRIRMIPQELTEDILVTILREGGRPVSEQVIRNYVHSHERYLSRGLRLLTQDEMLLAFDGGFKLSDSGEKEAVRILRAHRLWETYLQKVGAPEGQVHRIAHHLEHLHDNEAIGYIDGMLGHPEEGPHGESIPADPIQVTKGKKFQLSLLRTGSEATISAIGKFAKKSGLKAGDCIVLSGRDDDGKTWVVSVGRRKINLDHRTADDIEVELSGNNHLDSL
jgi:manganese/iron transport system permease protein/iron/zinc/copper transport system permease protein